MPMYPAPPMRLAEIFLYRCYKSKKVGCFGGQGKHSGKMVETQANRKDTPA